MKKILLITAAFLLSVSFAFAERESGMDLGDIFGKNQVGAGYDGNEWDTSLYVDFGTEKLRFSVNVLDLGGSWVNNGELTKNPDNTFSSVPFTRGLPHFFVGAGYKVNDTFRVALGYGGKLKQLNISNATKAGYYGNDISVFFQANVGANTIKFATPIQFGAGYGKDYNLYDPNGYELKNITAFSMAPQIRWLGQAGPLVQVRFAVPFGMAERKKADSYLEDEKISSVGVDLRVFLRFATDPVTVQFVPRIRYKQAIKGSSVDVNALKESSYGDSSDIEDAGLNKAIEEYVGERPWTLKVDLPLDLTASSDIVSVWVGPGLVFQAAGAPKVMYGVSKNTDGSIASYKGIRKENFYGLGFALPLEITIRPVPNLAFNIGMEAANTWSLYGESLPLNATVDGGVIWYF